MYSKLFFVVPVSCPAREASLQGTRWMAGGSPEGNLASREARAPTSAWRAVAPGRKPLLSWYYSSERISAPRSMQQQRSTGPPPFGRTSNMAMFHSQDASPMAQRALPCAPTHSDHGAPEFPKTQTTFFFLKASKRHECRPPSTSKKVALHANTNVGIQTCWSLSVRWYRPHKTLTRLSQFECFLSPQRVIWAQRWRVSTSIICFFCFKI